MEFEGSVWKSKTSKYWLAEVPSLDIMTQGISQKNAMHMILDAIKDQLMGYFPKESIDDLELVVIDHKKGRIGISASDSRLLLALSLRRQRIKSGATVREVAERLGSKSPNSYAPYERGEKAFSIDGYERLITAINPKKHPQLRVG